MTPPKGSRPWTPGIEWPAEGRLVCEWRSPEGTWNRLTAGKAGDCFEQMGGDAVWLTRPLARELRRLVGLASVLEPFDDPEDVGELVRAAEALLELIPSWGKPEYEAAVDALAAVLGRVGKEETR